MQTIQRRLEALNLDGLFLVNDSNIRYVSGYTNTDGYVLLTASENYFFTDYRYTEQVEKECPEFTVITVERDRESLEEIVGGIAADKKLSRIGFEENHAVFQLVEKIKNKLTATELIPTCGVIENVRYTKTEQEIACIKQAAEIADRSFDAMLGVLEPGITENEAMWQLMGLLRKFGAESEAFPIILISGTKTSMPHGMPSAKVIEPGDLVTMDFGALYKGYRSDMTRTVVMGTPDDTQKKVYNIVQEAQAKGIELVKSGAVGKDVNDAVSQVIDRYDYLKFAGKGLGHGLGLDIHEKPFMNQRCNDVLKENCVVTVEPGIYIPFWGGVRIEDTVVVQEGGCQVLCQSSKELVSI